MGEFKFALLASPIVWLAISLMMLALSAGDIRKVDGAPVVTARVVGKVPREDMEPCNIRGATRYPVEYTFSMTAGKTLSTISCTQAPSGGTVSLVVLKDEILINPVTSWSQAFPKAAWQALTAVSVLVVGYLLWALLTTGIEAIADRR